MKTDQQATSHQQCPPHQNMYHRRKAEMDRDGGRKTPGVGRGGRENVSEESQDKSKLPQSAHMTLSNWTCPAILYQQYTHT